MKMLNFRNTRNIILSILINFVIITGASAQEENNAGKNIFNNECASCHSGGFKGWVSGAPEIGNTTEWQTFLQKGQLKMTQATINGTQGMEPKGGCNKCTDTEIQSAVKYIVTQSK